jgi:E3 ubiquitin-protein ligase HUWE1
VRFQFYKIASSSSKESKEEGSSKDTQMLLAESVSREESSPLKPASSSNADSPFVTGTTGQHAKDKLSDGIIYIHLENVPSLKESPFELLKDCELKYQVPQEQRFSLHYKLLLAKDIQDLEKRQKWLMVRLYALAICISTQSAELVQSKVFMYEPDLVSKLASILSSTEEGQQQKYPYTLQSVVLFALECICHHRNKLPEVLSSLNASVNHGILFSLLRKMVTLHADRIYPIDFLEGIHTLVNYLTSTQSGGTMMISAGIIPILLSAVDISDVHSLSDEDIKVGYFFNF